MNVSPSLIVASALRLRIYFRAATETAPRRLKCRRAEPTDFSGLTDRDAQVIHKLSATCGKQTRKSRLLHATSGSLVSISK